MRRSLRDLAPPDHSWRHEVRGWLVLFVFLALFAAVWIMLPKGMA